MEKLIYRNEDKFTSDTLSNTNLVKPKFECLGSLQVFLFPSLAVNVYRSLSYNCRHKEGYLVLFIR